MKADCYYFAAINIVFCLVKPYWSNFHKRYFFLGERIDFDDKQWADIHVIAGALKWYFRELPEPVIPAASFDEFVNGISK